MESSHFPFYENKSSHIENQEVFAFVMSSRPWFAMSSLLHTDRANRSILDYNMLTLNPVLKTISKLDPTKSSMFNLKCGKIEL